MNKKITYTILILIGLVAGLMLSLLYTQIAMDKQKALDERVQLSEKLGDIKRLIREGHPEAAKIFDADLYQELGSMGNYYKTNDQEPSELDWLLLNPVIKYLETLDTKSMAVNDKEASEGIKYLKMMKAKSSDRN